MEAERDSMDPPRVPLQDADWEAFVDFALAMRRRRLRSRTLDAFELETLAREEQFYALDSAAFDAFGSI